MELSSQIAKNQGGAKRKTRGSIFEYVPTYEPDDERMVGALKILIDFSPPRKKDADAS